MKTLLSLAFCLLLTFSGVPLTARANITTEVYLLPESRAGQAYQSDIEAVLRDKYSLQIETSKSDSILQWFLLDGELPPGLTLRTNGSVVGTPSTYRAQPYQFRVRVIDQSVNNAEQLVIPLSITVAAPGLRLSRINGPTLVRSDDATLSRSNAAKQPGGPRAEGQVATPESAGASESVIVPVSASGPTSVKPAVQSDTKPDKSKEKGCGNRNTRKAVSDEAHTPLEGDTSTQNTCVQFRNLNTLKYRIEFSNKTTRTEGPDISSLPFLPKLTLTSTSTPATAGTAAPGEDAVPVAALSKRIAGTKAQAKARIESDLEKLDRRFNEVVKGLTVLEIDIRTNVEEQINQRTSAIENAHKQSVRLANNAGFYLQSGNVTGLLNEVKQTKDVVDPAVRAEWPSQEITNALNNLSDRALDLERLRLDESGNQDISQESWTAWLEVNQDRLTRVRERITELTTKVNTANNGLDDFNTAKNILADWQLVINNVHNQQAAAFEQEAYVSCQTDEGEGKTSLLTISKTDRTVSNPTTVSREVLTVHCYSRISLTAGFNFSTLDEKEFSVVESAGETPGTTVKKFGFTNRSSFRPNPLALLNIRFTDNPVINWHASFGAVVDLKGQTGTDVEPIAGVSFSIRRLIFITPFALHFGRVNKLAGGFNEGDVVPEGIATPPIEKAWKVGYTGGITFRIAPQ